MLNGQESKLEFGLLLNALWYESESFFSSPGLAGRFEAAFVRALPDIYDEEWPFFTALLAYMLAMDGRMEDARARLEEAKAWPDQSPYLQAHVAAVEGCLADMSSEACAPDAPFEP